MEIIGTVYNLAAVANRLGKSKKALKQAIYRLVRDDVPLIIGEFKFVLIKDLGYIAIDKDEELVVIAE